MLIVAAWRNQLLQGDRRSPMSGHERNKVFEALQRVALPSDSRHDDPRSERRFANERAVLIVDAGGEVQFCSNGAAQLFDSRSDEMLGRPIHSLIPDLPLQNLTPGYNVAYACFWSVQDDWRRLHRSAPDVQAAALEFKLKPAQRQQDNPYAFVVRLRGASK